MTGVASGQAVTLGCSAVFTALGLWEFLDAREISSKLSQNTKTLEITKFRAGGRDIFRDKSLN